MAEWHPLRSLPKSGDDDDHNQNIIIPQAVWRRYDKESEQLAKRIARNHPATVPSLDHTRRSDFDNVYEPSDDTFLLLDGIQYDLFSPMTEEEEQEDQHDGSDKKGDDDEDFIVSSSSRRRRRSIVDAIKCVMEVGTGSGIPITFLVQKLLQQADTYKAIKEDDISNTTSIRAIATDLNPAALRLAQRTAQQNGIFVVDRTDDGNGDGHEEGKQGDYEHLEALATGHTERRGCRRHKIQMEFVQCDLATPFLSTLENQVDCLIFNPPYVPTPDSEVVNVHVDQNDDDNGDSCTPMSRRSGDDVDDKLIEASWAGGERGRRVIDRFMFSQLPKLLSKPHGVAYLVTVDDNQPHELSCILLEQYNLQMRPLVRRRARNESLTIQKITWSET